MCADWKHRKVMKAEPRRLILRKPAANLHQEVSNVFTCLILQIIATGCLGIATTMSTSDCPVRFLFLRLLSMMFVFICIYHLSAFNVSFQRIYPLLTATSKKANSFKKQLRLTTYKLTLTSSDVDVKKD